jgi:spermidine/putrescine transport system substrate-binding protein
VAFAAHTHSDENDGPGAAGVASGALNRRQLLKRSLYGALGVASFGSLAACGSASQSASDAGGTIKFINYVNWIGKNEYADFAKLTGTHIQEIVANESDERVNKILEDPGVADMALLDLESGGRLAAAGKLATIDHTKIPNYKYVNSAFKTGLVSPSQAKGIPTDYGRIGIMYRTDLMKETPASWHDFWALAPKYSGKVNLIDDEQGVIQAALLSLGLNPNSTTEADVVKAGNALIAIKPHLLQVESVDDGKPMIEGNAVMGLIEDFAGTAAIENNPHLPLRWVNPSDGMPGYLDIWCAIKGTNELTQVEKFMNYQLTPKVTANYCNTLAIASIEPAANPYISAKLKASPVANPPASIYKHVAFQQFLGGAQKYWDNEWLRFQSA